MLLYIFDICVKYKKTVVDCKLLAFLLRAKVHEIPAINMTSVRSIQTIDSLILSEYILQVKGGMSHLKLQKLLYYIQGYHLAYFDHPIIEDDFEAWLHGPVSRKVYDKVKQLSVLYAEVAFNPDEWEKGQTPDILLQATLTPAQQDIVDTVIKEYGQMKDGALENLSHSESPWIEARKGYGVADRCNVVISKESMRLYYKEQMYG